MTTKIINIEKSIETAVEFAELKKRNKDWIEFKKQWDSNIPRKNSAEFKIYQAHAQAVNRELEKIQNKIQNKIQKENNNV